MAEESEGIKPQIVNYSNNSSKGKKEPAAKARPEMKKVVVGSATERPVPLRRRFMASFTGDDAQTVGQYIVFDVFVPAAKNFISDAVGQGIDRLLFGSSAPSGRGRSIVNGIVNGGGQTQYNRISSVSQVNTARELSRSARANHDFQEIILETRADAEVVIEQLQALIDEYGSATVADLYALVDISGAFTDQRYGWNNLSTADVRHIRIGYLLDLPKPIPLD